MYQTQQEEKDDNYILKAYVSVEYVKTFLNRVPVKPPAPFSMSPSTVHEDRTLGLLMGELIPNFQIRQLSISNCDLMCPRPLSD